MSLSRQEALSLNGRHPAQSSTCASPQCLLGSALPWQRHKSLALQISGRSLLCLHAAHDHLHSSCQSATDRHSTCHDSKSVWEPPFGTDVYVQVLMQLVARQRECVV